MTILWRSRTSEADTSSCESSRWKVESEDFVEIVAQQLVEAMAVAAGKLVAVTQGTLVAVGISLARSG